MPAVRSMLMSVSFVLVVAPLTLGRQTPRAASSNGPWHDVIAKALRIITEKYVNSEIAPAISEAILNRERAGDYNNDDPEAFAKRLGNDLQTASHDLHFAVQYSSTVLSNEQPSTQPTREQRFSAGRDRGYGFLKVEILSGNVGYIYNDELYRAEAIGNTLAAAMNLVASTDALIIDVREHDGGRPDAVALWVSYFVEGSPRQLDGIYWKPLGRLVESYTVPSVAGAKYLDRPVFVLQGHDTTSAGEGFCDNMKTLKLATLVGETTLGAANPGEMMRISEHFSVFVPTGRAVNPTTGKNWEGIGVQPDIHVKTQQALQRTHLLALETILEHASGDKRAKLLKIIERLKQESPHE